MRTGFDMIRWAVCALVVTGWLSTGAYAQQTADHLRFASPEAAVDAMVAALREEDLAALSRILGPDSDELLDSGDPVQDRSDRADFLAAYDAQHAILEEGEDRRTLVTGANDWPFAVPLVRGDGGWFLDGQAGVEEITYRRVGENELGAIAFCRGFEAAQRDYAAEGHDGDPAGVYAFKLLSDPGLHNGLYWPVSEGEPPSPAGPFVAAAAAEGYRRSESRTPYHGYYYRMLYRQGTHAAGGARDYFKDGLLTEGFALLAWPADYGVSGVMTFMANQDGTVYQKDLGEDTEAVAESLDAFDPDPSWAAVSEAAD